MKNRNLTLGVVLVVGAAMMALVARDGARAGEAATPGATPSAAVAPASPAERARQGERLTVSSNSGKPAAAAPMIQVSGRLIHSWMEPADVRVILVIDGFTVMTAGEQLTARDGCVWFDEAAARRTGKAVLGVYAETGVEYRKAGGAIEKFDSVYLEMESAGEVNLHSDEAVRSARADGTELFLRAKKLRKEFLESGRREAPTGVVPAPTPGPRVELPGVREAGVPQEITIVAQDDVRKVNFTSFVEDGMRVSVWSGGVFIIRGDMEMAADNVVIWTPEDETRRLGGGPKSPAAPALEGVAAAAAAGGKPAAESPAGAKPGAKEPARRLAAEAYLEGHVRVVQSRRMLQCSQMYYDFQRDQALAVDTKIKTFAKSRSVPVYYYAKEVRQLAQGIFVGTDARMTTCEFADPHYDIGAGKMTLTDLTPPPGESDEAPQYHRVRFVGEDVKARVRGMPLSWWPKLAGDVSQEDTALRSIRVGNSNRRGTGVQTQWHLLKLLGLEKSPEGFDLYLDADVWSKRGPAIGVQGEYERQDFFGEIKTYLIHDTGEDRLGSRDLEPPSEDRYRATWRHRHYLPDNWEMTLEFSKQSDRNFLNEFFERESKEDKRQETVFYLKKQELDQALTILAAPRLNSFQTTTEYYPQLGYNMIGRSLWQDHLTYFQDSEISVSRYRPDRNAFRFAQDPRIYMPPDPRNLRSSKASLVADTIHEIDMPLKAGVVNIVPFLEGRLSYFGDSLEGGAESRAAGKAGTRASTQAWKAYDGVDSDFWDVHRLRHVNIFDVSAYAAGVSTPARDLIPFDVSEAGTPVVEGVDQMGVTELGWRQRFQTMRGPAGKRVSVDWLTLDLEGTFYNNRRFPNIDPDGKRAFNHVDFLTDWKASDSVSLWTDTNYNTDDGTLDYFQGGATVVHTPRMSYTFGQRIIPDADSAIAFFGFDYQINEKWRVAMLEQYDFDRSGNVISTFTLTRRLHRWLMRIRIEFDKSKDDQFVGLEFQPLGIKEVRFGG